MPLYSYKCSGCGALIQKLSAPELSKTEQHCEKDGALLIRTPRMASAQVKEIVDNGLYARRVEVIKK
jgi:predicted nucleic acid-binding Zn ribbon protein